MWGAYKYFTITKLLDPDVIAAKAAQMRVFTVPDVDHKFNKQFGVADWQCENMHEVLRQFKELLPSTLA